MSAADDRTRDVTFVELLRQLKRAKWVIFAFAAFGAVVGGVLGLALTPWYDATVTISPTTENNYGNAGGTLSSLTSEFSGLASLAGLALSGTSKSAAESQAVLLSEHLTEDYVKKNNLLPILFAKQWDSVTGTWKPSSDGKVPTLWRGYKLFDRKVRDLTTDPKTQVLKLRIRWSDPHVAATWANGLVGLTNEYLRNQALQEANRDIAYLESVVATTETVQLKDAASTLIKSELNKAMMAKGNEEFAFKVLDPASAPERPSSLNWPYWAVLGLVCGLLLGLLGVILALSGSVSKD